MTKPAAPNSNAFDRLKKNLPALAVLAVVLGGVGIFIYESTDKSSGGAIVDVRVPELTELARQGEKAFAANCKQCHGDNAAGGNGGPPLVHNIYNPGHHADGAFYLAFQRGVPQHHWRFGNMPPQPQIGRDEAIAIVRYIRELQVANGIGHQPHRMR